MSVITGLNVTPVKATRLHRVDRIELGPAGVRENRRFYVIDERDRMINSKIAGELQTVIADYSDSERQLKLTFSNGSVVQGNQIAANGAGNVNLTKSRGVVYIPGV